MKTSDTSIIILEDKIQIEQYRMIVNLIKAMGIKVKEKPLETKLERRLREADEEIKKGTLETIDVNNLWENI